MKIFRSASARLALVCSLLLATFDAAPVAYASVITTDEYAQVESRSASEARVNDFLARDDVRAQLERLGVNPDDASARVSAMTPEELAQIDRRIGELPAGGDVIAVIGIVFVVLLILELVGVTNIFTKF